MDKYSAAEKIPCNQRTAQRMLAQIHENKSPFPVRIVDWKRSQGSSIPVYIMGAGRDVEKPKLRTYAEKSREYRSDPAVRYKQAMGQRAKRSLNKIVRLGIFGA